MTPFAERPRYQTVLIWAFIILFPIAILTAGVFMERNSRTNAIERESKARTTALKKAVLDQDMKLCEGVKENNDAIRKLILQAVPDLPTPSDATPEQVTEIARNNVLRKQFRDETLPPERSCDNVK